MGSVTSVLESIWADTVVPMLAAAFPALAAALNIPIVGSLLTAGINAVANWLIKNGVIQIKMEIIDILDTASQTKWASEIVILKQVQKGGLTPAQQVEFDDALQALVNSRAGVINA